MKGSTPNIASSLSQLRKRLSGFSAPADTKPCGAIATLLEGTSKKSSVTSTSRQTQLGINIPKPGESYYPFVKRGSAPRIYTAESKITNTSDEVRAGSICSDRIHPLTSPTVMRRGLLCNTRSPTALRTLTAAGITSNTVKSKNILKPERSGSRNTLADSPKLRTSVSTQLLFSHKSEVSPMCSKGSPSFAKTPGLLESRASLTETQPPKSLSHIASLTQLTKANTSTPHSWEDFHSALHRVKQTRQRLQECLHNLRGERPQESGPIENAGRVPTSFKSAFIENDKSTSIDESTSRGLAADEGQPSQPSCLKQLLLSPISQGMEMSLNEFRQLERSPSASQSPNKKGCLKLQTQPKEGSVSTELPEQPINSKPTLKRGVSFSENVVMFIYQA